MSKPDGGRNEAGEPRMVKILGILIEIETIEQAERKTSATKVCLGGDRKFAEGYKRIFGDKPSLN